jgi:hypothetical protein
MEIHMHCVLCENLQRTFEARQREYIESGSLAYYQVSKKFAAYKNVEMERARIELQEHQAECLAALSLSARIPAAALLRPRLQERRRNAHVGAAA